MSTVHLAAALFASPTLTAPLRPWGRSAVRTLAVPPWTGLREMGGPSSPLALRWPSKAPEEVEDFSLDFTALLADAGDTIASAGASVSGDALTVEVLAIGGAVVTLWLGGGTACGLAFVTVSVIAASGRAWSPTAMLHVRGPVPPTTTW